MIQVVYKNKNLFRIMKMKIALKDNFPPTKLAESRQLIPRQTETL